MLQAATPIVSRKYGRIDRRNRFDGGERFNGRGRDRRALCRPFKSGALKRQHELDVSRAALVVVDPQIDFMSPKGKAWPVVGESVTEHNVVANLGRLLEAAKAAGIVVAISPHYYYHWDHTWKIQATGRLWLKSLADIRFAVDRASSAVRSVRFAEIYESIAIALT